MKKIVLILVCVMILGACASTPGGRPGGGGTPGLSEIWNVPGSWQIINGEFGDNRANAQVAEDSRGKFLKLNPIATIKDDGQPETMFRVIFEADDSYDFSKFSTFAIDWEPENMVANTEHFQWGAYIIVTFSTEPLRPGQGDGFTLVAKWTQSDPIDFVEDFQAWYSGWTRWERSSKRVHRMVISYYGPGGMDGYIRINEIRFQ